MELDPRKAARHRAGRIASFREELAALETEQGLVLSPEQRAGLEAHHRSVLEDLHRRWGVDTTESARRVSWGIRMAALMATAALIAAAVLFLHRIWIHLPPGWQIGILVVAPLVPLGFAGWTAHRRWDGFFTGLFALAAGGLFIAELNALGALLNLAPSPHALLAWSAFALLAAHALGQRLVLAGGLVLACAYGGALGLHLRGAFWEPFLQHPQGMMPAAALVYAVPWVALRRDPFEFAGVHRVCGAGVGLLALLIESLGNDPCCGPFSGRGVGTAYQLAGLGLSAAVVGHGIRLGQRGLVHLGAAMFVVLLYARLHAWWWHWMPKYLFFLLLGLCAVGLLWAFHRVRRHLSERGAA